MKEINEIELQMKRIGMTKAELSERSGFSLNQLRRMFKGNIDLKELARLRSILAL